MCKYESACTADCFLTYDDDNVCSGVVDSRWLSDQNSFFSPHPYLIKVSIKVSLHFVMLSSVLHQIQSLAILVSCYKTQSLVLW